MENYTTEDEISLRKLIEILLKGWKWIIIIPLICGIVAYGYSKYVMTPTYESKVILEIHARSDKATTITSVNSIDEALSAQPLTQTFSMDSYIQQLTSPEIILGTLRELNLSDQYTYEQFKGKVAVSQTKDSSLLTITITDKDPEMAATIANTLSATFMRHVSAKKEEQLDTSTALLTQQLDLEKQKLDDVLLEVKEFESQEKNLDFMNQELTLNNSKLQNAKSNLSTLTDNYKKEKYELEQDIKASKEKVAHYESLLNQTAQTFNLKKDVLDSTIGTNYAATENVSLEDQVALSVESEELNPVYVSTLGALNAEKIHLINLETSITKSENMYNYNYSTLTTTISTLETTINTARREIADLSYQKSLLDDKLAITKQTYTAFNNKLESARVAKAANISETSVLLMSEGVAPSNPTGPRKLLNTAIAIVLGGMVVVFGLFFQAYWKNSATPSK
ncbi:MAG: hypothetical protein JXQ26_08695 [Tissierellales bacterium]|nr:hypothetical protein [Tissierellales bacterium]